MPSTLKKAYSAALVQTLIIGLSFLFVKIALRYAGAIEILAHRFSLSFAIACVPVLCGWVRLRIDWKRDLAALLPVAIFYPTLFFALQAYGLVHTSSSEAGIIQATGPIFTTLLAVFFLRERVSRWQLGMVLLSVGGVGFIFAMQGVSLSDGSLWGNVLILLSALSLAGYNVCARKVGQTRDIFSMTFIMLLAGCIAFNILALVNYLGQRDAAAFFQPLRHWQYVGSLLYLGILSSLVTAYLSNYALSKIKASQMSLFLNLATLTTILAGVLLLGEHLYWYHIVGGLAILCGIIGSNLKPKQLYPKR